MKIIRLPCFPVTHELPVTHTHHHKRVRVRTDELIFAVSYMTGVSLFQLPFENIDGNPIPTVIFSGQPSTFHAFLFCLMFSFYGAVSSMNLRGRDPKVARRYQTFAVVAMSVTLAILMWAAVPAGFRLIAPFVLRAWC